MTTQLVLVSTPESLLAAAAAVDAELLGSPRERVLVTVAAPGFPELDVPLSGRAGIEGLLDRFDRVVSVDDLIGPLDPRTWSPSGGDRPVLEPLLRAYWGLADGPVEVVVDAEDEQPGEWLTSVFYGCLVTVLGSTLRAYGPVPGSPSWGWGRRVHRHLYVDRVPGLLPWSPDHSDAEPVAIPAPAWDGVLASVGAPIPPTPAGSTVGLVVGENLAGRRLASHDDETRLLETMVRAAADDGAEHVVVVPDPADPVVLGQRLAGVTQELAARGVTVTVAAAGPPPEAWLAAVRPAVVVGCFAPVLLAAHAAGVRPRSVGAAEVKERLTPYSHPDRIPHTLVDAVLRDGSPWASVTDLRALVRTVAHCMYPERLASLRDEAAATLAATTDAEVRRYPTMRRAQQLRLLETADPAAARSAGTPASAESSNSADAVRRGGRMLLNRLSARRAGAKSKGTRPS